MVPIPSGAGIPATKLPNSPVGNSQTSTSMAVPCSFLSMRPSGTSGWFSRKGVEFIVREVVVRPTNLPLRLVNSPFSGRPDKCAPQTATLTLSDCSMLRSYYEMRVVPAELSAIAACRWLQEAAHKPAAGVLQDAAATCRGGLALSVLCQTAIRHFGTRPEPPPRHNRGD